MLVELKAIELYISGEILSELRDVLTRPRVRQRFPALTDELVGAFLTVLGKRAIHIPEVPRLFVYERDPRDEPYINLAIAAGARYLVSRDSDILDLAARNSPDGLRLRHYAPQLQILDPVSFLEDMRRTIDVPGRQ